jgi:hypothetical protein
MDSKRPSAKCRVVATECVHSYLDLLVAPGWSDIAEQRRKLLVSFPSPEEWVQLTGLVGGAVESQSRTRSIVQG